MAESPTQSPVKPPANTSTNTQTTTPNDETFESKIPTEIISEEEMALIEAAYSATRFSLSSPAAAVSSSASSLPLRQNARSIGSISILSKRRLSDGFDATSSVGDIEDLGRLRNNQKRNKLTESLLHRFRRKRGLSVTDITATEWCQKQMEFKLLLGKPEITKAMKAGSARHAALAEEVVKREAVQVTSIEDIWGLKFLNFIIGANQLLFDGLTRELPLIGFVEGAWVVGVIDEIRMPVRKCERNPILVETKTRGQATLPSEPQQRNARLQLMCYKYLWDNLIADNFSSRQFFDFFSLNPHLILCEETRESTAKSGFPAKTLDDLIKCFRNTCCVLPPACDQLLLRYELQEDNSLLGEAQFSYDSEWVKGQIQSCLGFWQGDQEACFTPKDERWKCHFCPFAPVCPVDVSPVGSPT